MTPFSLNSPHNCKSKDWNGERREDLLISGGQRAPREEPALPSLIHLVSLQTYKVSGIITPISQWRNWSTEKTSCPRSHSCEGRAGTGPQAGLFPAYLFYTLPLAESLTHTTELPDREILCSPPHNIHSTSSFDTNSLGYLYQPNSLVSVKILIEIVWNIQTGHCRSLFHPAILTYHFNCKNILFLLFDLSVHPLIPQLVWASSIRYTN